jgi:hypothetical protein
MESVIHARLDEQVERRIIEEARGNPLALLELPRGFRPVELAGGFSAPVAPLAGRIEESFRRWLSKLPEDTQRLLVVAAVEPAEVAEAAKRCPRLADPRGSRHLKPSGYGVAPPPSVANDLSRPAG